MLTGILAGLAAGALWGLVFVVPRMLPGLSSIDIATGRLLAYGLIALAIMAVWMRGRPLPTWRQAGAALFLSVLGFTGYYLLLVLAIRDAGVEVPTLIIGTIPVWVMLLGKPAGLLWRRLLPGLVLTALGLALMMDLPQWLPVNPLTDPVTSPLVSPAQFWQGVAWAVASMLCWTVFAIFNSAWVLRHPEVSAADWANWLGVATGVGALVLGWAGASNPAQMLANPQWGLLVGLCLATGLGSSWLATVLWNIASQRLSASLCGQLIVSETLFALLYSFAWDGHWPSAAQWLACVLFAAGILASIKAHK